MYQAYVQAIRLSVCPLYYKKKSGGELSFVPSDAMHKVILQINAIVHAITKITFIKQNKKYQIHITLYHTRTLQFLSCKCSLETVVNYRE